MRSDLRKVSIQLILAGVSYELLHLCSKFDGRVKDPKSSGMGCALFVVFRLYRRQYSIHCAWASWI